MHFLAIGGLRPLILMPVGPVLGRATVPVFVALLADR